MNRSKTSCSDDRLRSLLGDDEHSPAFRQAAQHVESCASCQTRLEHLAADAPLWREARTMLTRPASGSGGRADEQAGERADNLTGDSESDRRRWNGRPAVWTDSMAQQLLSPPSHPEMLGRIGRYEVERRIGSGGMGVVFKAFDTELNRPVAVKVLAPYLAGSGAARKRFAREARAAAAVVHEHVVAIHNVESDGEAPFLVMPFVAGESLQQRIDREGPLELCEILRIATQTASGLAAAHAQGLVHRDVKPSNILLELGVERALLTDFGLARASDDASLTHTGFHPGTPQFMSPEQARGDAVDKRSDLFSFGSVIYTMCTGHSPFRAETSYGILRRITDADPRSMREINPAIPEWLEGIVARLHAKSPDHRFRSADDVHTLLEQCLAHVQQPTTMPLPAECRQYSKRSVGSAARRVSRYTAGALALAAVSAVLLAAVVYSLGNPNHATNTAGDTVGTDVDVHAPAAPAPPVRSDDSATDWELTAKDLDTYRQDLAPFEARTRQLWDDHPQRIEE